MARRKSRLGLPIDGEPVSGCLWDFENMMPESTSRPRWDWFQEMFGELPNERDADACTETFSWLKSRFGAFPRDASDELVLRHARAYIWMLLSTCLFRDKTGARAHVSVLSSQQECRPGGRAVGSAAELDFLAVSPPSALRLRPHRVAIGLQVSPHIRREGAPTVGSQEAARFDALQRVRLSPVSEFGGRGGARSMHSAGGSQGPLFGGVQNRPHPTLNIEFLHSRDGQGSDQWFSQTYQHWNALWATRFEQLFEVVQSADPGPTVDFIQWWILAARRYLVPADQFHRLPPDEIPIEATQRQSNPHPARPDVPHAPDNRQPRRRMMVGTRTTDQD
ncbi:hypothetical protein PIB30_070771 [Stylosanthes scabra]|uniref:Uncharacterized protein n=1 Tax=Stylosanthes scabra TaxID=79078 RepID=A0ABU6ZME4_9FABA|nr:hypothetical protein [Stylosanthes scabra]